MRKVSLRLKLLIGLLLMAAVLIIALTMAISKIYRERMENYYSEVAFDQASIAAKLIDPDAIRRYYETGQKDAYYEEVRKMLLTAKQAADLKYFYVVVPEKDVMVYIWDAGVEGEEGVCELLDTDSYYGGGDELMHAAFSKDAERVILVTNDAEYGYLASAYVAILDGDEPVALASVDVSMDMINDQIKQFVYTAMAISFIILALSVIAYFLYVRGVIINPIAMIAKATKEFAERSGDENLVVSELKLKGKDEITELSHTVLKMEQDILDYTENIRKTTAEKERIGAELNVATQIQADMLPIPDEAFTDREDFNIYASMTPAKEVGGDFYDFFLVDDKHLALVIADVSGKGVPAALFMVIAKTLIKNAVLQGLSPKDALEKANNQLCENNKADMFVTVWLGIMDTETGKTVASNAGHEYPTIRRPGEAFELIKDKHGMPLGTMEGIHYKEYDFEIPDGGTLYVYTDGVAEATSNENELFGTERMLSALNSEPDAGTKKLLANVAAGIKDFVGDADQFDDITMLSVKRSARKEG
ncbi:MAG: PP2C family protein-serine/threonine phosphatase [Lachnospiraceae bacterium]|nr:PP2C family protein-serine/threonine phosphatase [Lachnospiraceae bacterium]